MPLKVVIGTGSSGFDRYESNRLQSSERQTQLQQQLQQAQQQNATQIAARTATQKVSSDAVVVTFTANVKSFVSEKVASPHEAKELADEVAEKIRDDEGEGLDAHDEEGVSASSKVLKDTN